jgi:hypothetical protein
MSSNTDKYDFIALNHQNKIKVFNLKKFKSHSYWALCAVKESLNKQNKYYKNTWFKPKAYPNLINVT